MYLLGVKKGFMAVKEEMAENDMKDPNMTRMRHYVEMSVTFRVRKKTKVFIIIF